MSSSQYIKDGLNNLNFEIRKQVLILWPLRTLVYIP